MAAEDSDHRTGEPPAGPPQKPSWTKRILVGMLVLLVALVLLIAIQPSDFRISRSAVMAAEPAAVFEQVNNLHAWEAWSPWAKLDPTAKSTFEGPTSGKGSVMTWDGNSDVGAGSMTIVESQPNERVQIKLDFVRPMEATSDVEFLLEPKGEGTSVTWSMAGKNNFMGKAISLVMDCEKMVGGQFEQGLANMKKVVEKPAAQPADAGPEI